MHASMWDMVLRPGKMSLVVAEGKRQNRQEGTHAAEAVLKQQYTNEVMQRRRYRSDDPGDRKGGEEYLMKGYSTVPDNTGEWGNYFM